jgi:hypothetical protein
MTMTDRDLHAVSWFCRLCRILDMPQSERQPAPRFRSTKECAGRVNPPLESLDVDDLPGD